VNVLIASDGATGSVITVIPEPSVAALLACLAGLAFLRRRV
jgi:hypothetical protein